MEKFMSKESEKMMIFRGELFNIPSYSGEKNINPRVFYNENSKRTFTYSLIIRITVAAKVLKNNLLYCNDFCCI